MPDVRPQHTDREYEAELQQLRENLLLMAGRVEGMIAQGVRSVVARDPDLARQTIKADLRVDESELHIDELCLQVLAKRQPVASDLRLLTQTLKMVTDLERIGDLAVNVCERAMDLANAPRLLPFPEGIERMSEIVQTMVRDAIDAFVEGDVGKARKVIFRDGEVDQLYQRTFTELLERMRQDSSTLERAIHVQSIAKWLERMADHATNLAEHVIFMIQGEDVRHPRSRTIR
jgi:phosphate transport system protein